MISLFNPFRAARLRLVTPKRSIKTPGALYRILREDFESRRPRGCSCRMPMIFERERSSLAAPNWSVEPLWCGSEACQRAVAEVVAQNAKLFDLFEMPAESSYPQVASAAR